MAAENTLKQYRPDNFDQYRHDFPALSKTMNGKPLAYLDTASSAQKPQIVINAMQAVMEQSYSNIHRGLYKISLDLTTDYEAVRSKVAGLINAPSERNIVFTRNTTEAINLVAQSWGGENLGQGDEIILTEMEHHANIVPWQLLSKNKGFTIKVCPITDDGALDMEAFRSLLGPKTKFVGCVHISNALGTINPVKEIIGLARSFDSNIKVLIDGTQAVVHGQVDVQALDADFYTFTVHKLYGPTGIGVLYGKEDLLNAMPPYQGGGDMIERVSFDGTSFKDAPYKFEAGTPPIVEVIGLGAAIDYISVIGADDITVHENMLLDYAMEQMKTVDGLRFYGTAAPKTAIISFTMDGAHHSDVTMILDQCGVAVRSGHHCCMPLMDRFGIDGTIRASIGLYTNKNDVDQLVNAVKKAREMLV